MTPKFIKVNKFVYLVYWRMQKDNQLSYDIDGTKINPFTVQEAYDQAKASNRTLEMLANTFKLLDLASQNEK